MSSGAIVIPAPVVEEDPQVQENNIKSNSNDEGGGGEIIHKVENNGSIASSKSLEQDEIKVDIEKEQFPTTTATITSTTTTTSDPKASSSSSSEADMNNSNNKQENSSAVEAANKKEAFHRLRKRKVVLMMSYCGQNYFGMQKNPGMKTIEEELFNSLLKNSYIDEETMKRPQVAHFQRAARTDKHVSAARQIVSFKGPEEVDIDKINEHLPPEIRVMGIKRVTKGFDAKNQCDARTYSYMIPTFAFAPIEVPVTEAFRITPEKVAEVQKALNLYLGPKNYHNFTSRKRPNDPSARRMIYSFVVEQPFEKDGLEYCVLKVKGQSFMLHQIRKMIGLVVAYMRGFASLDTFEKCWGPDRIDIPKAPGVGLMLDYVHYARYDKRFGADGMHDTLTWDSQEEKVLEFCDEYIYPIVTKTENEEKSMLDWLSTLPYHTYDVRDAGPPPTDIEVALGRANGSSQIGQAFHAVAAEQGEQPYFSKKCHSRVDDDDDEVEDDDDNAPKKARLQVEN